MDAVRRPWARLTGLLAIALAAVWLAGLVVFAQRVTGLAEPPANDRTDAIVALTGEVNRLRAGLSLLESGVADRLFISGVHTDVETEYLLSLLQEDTQETECCIDVGREAINTKGNATETAAWIEANGVRSVRLVTSNYHMPRSLLEFRREMPDLTILPHPIDSEAVALHPWYGNLSAIRLMASEFSKFVIVRLGG